MKYFNGYLRNLAEQPSDERADEFKHGGFSSELFAYLVRNRTAQELFKDRQSLMFTPLDGLEVTVQLAATSPRVHVQLKRDGDILAIQSPAFCSYLDQL